MYEQVALFDLDGVVLDTESQYTKFWTEIGRKYLPHRPNYAEEIKGNTLTSIFERDFTKPQQRAEIETALISFETQMSYTFIPGIKEFIKHLQQKNIPTAIVTSSNNTKMQTIFRLRPEICQMFNHFFTAEDTPKGKPAPDCYLIAASYFGIDIHQCVIFEDSINGLQSAQTSGAKVVALTTTNPYEIVQPFADIIITDFNHLSSNQLFQ